MATGTFVNTDRSQISAAALRSWGFYGLPPGVRTHNSAEAKAIANVSPVGEVRYVVGWQADQMSRMDWAVTVNGSLSWTLTLPSKVTITSDEEADTDEPTHPRAASAQLLGEAIGWGSSVVRQVTTNLFVAGELDYAITKLEEATGRPTWQVISVIRPDRQELLDQAKISAHGIWPHPADPEQPDAPLFGVLDVLDELVWLTRLASSQSRNRVGMRGILGAADGLSFANGGDFWDEWTAAMGEPMSDPGNVAPMVLRGASELVEPTANGMKGLSWIVPTLPYDDKVDARIASAIQRLAYGLPTPPEILLGMQAQSRATAFQVEENSYRAHIEPAADLVANLATSALSQVLDVAAVEVVPDPTDLLARHHTTTDALEAFDRGAVSFDFLREALAIPADAAPTPEDLALWLKVQGRDSTADTAPSDEGRDAAEEPVEGRPGTAQIAGPGMTDRVARYLNAGTLSIGAMTAAVGPADGDPLTEAELDELAEKLEAIDAALLLELGGATQQAVERARERVGAKARTSPSLRGQVPADVPNDQVAAYLGTQALSDAGVPITGVTDQAVSGLLQWWRGRAKSAQEQAATIVAPSDPRFNGRDIDQSVEVLAAALIEHVMTTLDSPVAQPLDAETRQDVISVAGGAD